MSTKPGQKIQFEDLGVEVVVTVGGEGDVTAEAGPDVLQIGKRYLCENTGTQVLVTKAASARLLCGGAPMEVQEPKTTKAAD